jgi:hypothetical protein
MICEVCDKNVVLCRTHIEGFPLSIARCNNCKILDVVPKWVLIRLLARLKPDHTDGLEKSLTYFNYDRDRIITSADALRAKDLNNNVHN